MDRFIKIIFTLLFSGFIYGFLFLMFLILLATCAEAIIKTLEFIGLKKKKPRRF